MRERGGGCMILRMRSSIPIYRYVCIHGPIIGFGCGVNGWLKADMDDCGS